MTETLPRDAAGQGEHPPLPEIEYVFEAHYGGEVSEQFATRDEARAWIAEKREVSGNPLGNSFIDQIEV